MLFVVSQTHLLMVKLATQNGEQWPLLIYDGHIRLVASAAALDVYVKWNKLLYDETYMTYLSGRSLNDPSQTWYEYELSLFKSRILPLSIMDESVLKSYFHPSFNHR
jgi:hypothetical protein